MDDAAYNPDPKAHPGLHAIALFEGAKGVLALAFAGGLLGTLAELGDVTRENLHKALVNATVTAAFTCEAFSVDRLRQITRAELDERAAAFRRMLP